MGAALLAPVHAMGGGAALWDQGGCRAEQARTGALQGSMPALCHPRPWRLRERSQRLFQPQLHMSSIPHSLIRS